MFNSFDDLIKISSPGKILGHGASVPFLDLAILPSLDQIYSNATSSYPAVPCS
jgi:hypothetical protein